MKQNGEFEASGNAAGTEVATGEDARATNAGQRPAPRRAFNTSAHAQHLAKQAKDLAQAAGALETASLFEEIPFEEAFCLSPEEVAKRYTAENARQIEWRRRACVKLLARQCATQDIEDILGMNRRTVSAIAAQEGQAIAVFSQQYSDTLAASAMSDLAFAQTKRDSAGYKDLHIGAGIKLTHATALKMIGAGGEDADGLTQLEEENPALVKAREWLKRRRRSNQSSVSSDQSSVISEQSERAIPA